MKKILFLIGFSWMAFANPGLDAAMEVCESMTFDSDQVACMAAVRGKNFDPKATVVCKAMTFDSDKLTCLKTIADKYFKSKRQVALCGGQTFDSDKIKCLKNCDTGAILPGPGGGVDLKALRRLALEAKRMVRRGYYQDALYVLDDLLDEIDDANAPRPRHR